MTAYLSPSVWIQSLFAHWFHVLTGCIIMLVVSNGIESTAATITLPIHGYQTLVSDAFKDTGMTWKTSLVQAIVHWVWGVIQVVNKSTPSHPPFPEKKRSHQKKPKPLPLVDRIMALWR